MQTLTQVTEQNHRQPIILVVEDHEDNLSYMVSALALFNCRAIPTQNPIEGLDLAQEYQPELIILDIQMPNLSGIDLIKIFRLDWLTRNIPVIAVTALAGEEEKERILDAGFDDYLAKPFLLNDLEKVIRSHTTVFN